MTVIFHQPSCFQWNQQPPEDVEKKSPRPDNSERSLDRLKRKEQPMNEKAQSTSPKNFTEKQMDLDLSIV